MRQSHGTLVLDRHSLTARREQQKGKSLLESVKQGEKELVEQVCREIDTAMGPKVLGGRREALLKSQTQRRLVKEELRVGKKRAMTK